MNIKLITMFNVMPKAVEADRLSFEEVNKESAKYGWIIHPDCCSKLALNWIKAEARSNYNATFYKEWSDITSKTRLELLIDQIRHYASTYGTDFTQGNGYVPNDTPDVNIPFEKFKVIMPATEAEIFARCYDMLKAGIALKEETVKLLAEYMVPMIKAGTVEFSVDEIKNKEAQVVFCEATGLTPLDPFALLRYMVYSATGKTMLIKDKTTINAIKASNKINLTLLTENQRIALSTIFNRFKPLFLAMKKSGTTNTVFENKAFKNAAAKVGIKFAAENNAHVVNEIRRLAKVNHKPFHAGFWETIISEEKDLNEVKARLAKGDIANFKKITLMQAINEKLNNTTGKVFVIRNGKVWVNEQYKPKKSITKYLMKLYLELEESLVNSIKDKACTVRIPKNVEFTIPTSEKNFIGNYPFGTSVAMGDKNNIVGIYWRNEWHTNDFDLHMSDIYGYSYGWCNNYTNKENNIIYSGDMTNAEPEATELFYISKDAPDGKICVNKFRGDDCDSQFKLFVASENIEHKLTNCTRRTDKPIMCDPNNVVAEFMIPVPRECRQTECALIADNKVYLMDLSAGNSRVPNNKYAQIYIDQLKNKCRSFIKLNDILEQAGFTFVDDPDVEVGLDLTNPDKDALIKLFA